MHFYDSLNFALMLDPGCEFFCAISFNDEPYQEKNFKSHSTSVLLCK